MQTWSPTTAYESYPSPRAEWGQSTCRLNKRVTHTLRVADGRRRFFRWRMESSLALALFVVWRLFDSGVSHIE